MILLKFLKLKQFILLIILFAIFIMFRSYLCHSFIFADDTDTSRLFLNFKDILFNKPSNGIYISSFLDRIFAANLPFLLNIHPSSFKSEYFSAIEAFLLIFFISILSASMKKNLNYICLFLFSTAIILYTIQMQPFLLFVYDGFFRMLLPVFMFIALFLLCIKNKTKISFISMPVLTFLCSISNEMICVTTLIGFFLYSAIAFYKQNKYKYLYFVCTLSAFAGMSLLFHTGAFFRKIPSLVLFDMDFILVSLNSFGEFTKDYIKYIFLYHIFAYSLLIFQGIFLRFKLKNCETGLGLIICFNIGILIFFAALIFLGKTHANQYWIVHEDLHVIYSIVLCTFNMVLAQTAINSNLFNAHFVNYILIIMTFTLLCKNYLFYEHFIKYEIDFLRIETYKAEKILIYANQKNKTAYIDEICSKTPYLWALWYSTNDNNKNITYNNSPYIEYLNQFMHNKINVNYIFSEKEKTEKEFASNGGNFSRDELKNIDFNKIWLH